MEKILSCGCHKVSNNGLVYSRIKQFSAKGKQGIQTTLMNKWKKLKPVLTTKGYLQVGIHGRIFRVNRLVSLLFIKNHYKYPESQHINGCKTDNRAKNLKWGSAKDNAIDRAKHGNTLVGSRSPNAKLDERSVKEIRKKRGIYSLNYLAKEYQVSKRLILLVCQRKSWGHI